MQPNMAQKKKFILVILDGWGLAPSSPGNAISLAKTPTMDSLERHYPAFSLQASGIAVGLPWGEEGNSEVGHLNIGAGKIVFQYLPRIENAIHDGSFFSNDAFLKAEKHVKKNDSTLHIMGLLSSGNVHSYVDHLYAILEFAKQKEIERVALHVFTDGKDSIPKEGATFVQNLKERLAVQKTGQIATIMGRAFPMDRSNHWNLTQKAYRTLTGDGDNHIQDPVEYIEKSYEEGKIDLDIEPAIVGDKYIYIKENDAVIFFNFRGDSARQITKAFVLPDQEFAQFPRKKIPNLLFVSMTEYEKLLPTEVAFSPPTINYPFARVLSEQGYKQLHVAETEKYAHVTYFLNGEREKPFPGEERIIVPSIGAPYYDRNPEMGTFEITRIIKENIENTDAIIVNYSNSDLLGHTGNMKAVIEGIETVDASIQELVTLAEKNNAYLFITSDHGNAESMKDPRTGFVNTKHTNNPVPLYVVHPSLKKSGISESLQNKSPDGILADVAPTILSVLDIQLPEDMTGEKLLTF